MIPKLHGITFKAQAAWLQTMLSALQWQELEGQSASCAKVDQHSTSHALHGPRSTTT